MKSLGPLELIRAGRWRRATLTTYALSASFAEAVVVEALLRQGTHDITVLTDPVGYAMAGKEQGAVRIGREYAVHPVVVTGGCFHPKLIVLEPEDDGPIHALVGSCNLTFGGWSANLECVDHIDTSGSPEAMRGLAGFFEALAGSRRCAHEARALCAELAARISARVGDRVDDGGVRLVHSLSGNIAAAVAAAAEELGGATRLTCVSPYWDGAATDRLAGELGLAEYSAHVPTRAVTAPRALDWPRGSSLAKAVSVSALCGDDHGGRDLHAKLLEVVCRRGRVVLGGSANATGAALYAGPEGGNVEVCTLRLERSARRAWKVKPAKAPPLKAASEAELEAEETFGVLVAEHGADGIEGRILSPWSAPAAAATLTVGRNVVALGVVAVDSTGRFSLPFDLIADEELSLAGRVQLRLRADASAAEGFVSAPDFKTLRRRAGTALPAMLAALKQMQTPEDVLAILEFFHANPGELGYCHAFKSASRGSGAAPHDPIVVAALVGAGGKAGRRAGGQDADQDPEQSKSQLAWQKLIERLLASMAKARPQREYDEDEQDPVEQKRRRRSENARNKIGLRFPAVFQAMTKTVEDDNRYLGILRLTHFVCVTTLHEGSAGFVARLVQIALQARFGAAARQSAAWCAVYLAGLSSDPVEVAVARTRLAVLGLTPDDLDTEFELPGLFEVIAPGAELQPLLASIRACRTVHEEVRLLEAALGAGALPDNLPTLEGHEGWPQLKAQLLRAPERRRVHFVDRPVSACPRCNIRLLDHQASALGRTGVVEACHGFILARNA